MSEATHHSPRPLWACAFEQAHGLVQWFRADDRAYWDKQHEDAPEQVTVVLALAIAREADEQGLPVAQVSDLDEISIPALYADRLDRARITHDVLAENRLAPTGDDPGRDTYLRITQRASDPARRDEWNELIDTTLAVLMAHTTAGTSSLYHGLTLGQRRSAPRGRGRAEHEPKLTAEPAAIGPDFMRSLFPPEMLERLGRMNAAAYSMVLAYFNENPDDLVANADLITNVDDDPVQAASPYAGKWPGTRYSFAVSQTMELVATWLEVARRTSDGHFTNAEVVDGARQLISRVVPEDHRTSALAVADQMPSDPGPLGGFPLVSDQAELGDLYFVTAVAGWLAGSPKFNPSRETVRTQLIRQIRDFDATALGVPEAERISDISDAQALELLDSLLGQLDGQAAVARDPRQRSLVELDILQMTKAHMLEHPERTRHTDRLLLQGIDRVLDASARRRQPASAASEMTETERRRAEKLAAREQHRKNPKRRKGRNARSGATSAPPKPALNAVPGMAPDVPMPSKDDPAGPAAYYRRVLDHALHGSLFLQNYLAYVDDGGFHVPAKNFEPQRPDETAEDAAKRREVAYLIKATQAAAGSWAELCAEELRHIKPSDAGAVATFILGRGFEWCRESGFDPTANGFRSGATPLLTALCPVEQRDQALRVLDTFWEEIAFKRPPSIESTAAKYPIAAIHVAAAMTGWLFSEPDCVPNRATAQMKLIEQTEKILDPTGDRTDKDR